MHIGNTYHLKKRSPFQKDINEAEWIIHILIKIKLLRMCMTTKKLFLCSCAIVLVKNLNYYGIFKVQAKTKLAMSTTIVHQWHLIVNRLMWFSVPELIRRYLLPIK